MDQKDEKPMIWTKYDQKILKKSIEDAKKGKFIPHEEVMKEFRKKVSSISILGKP